MSRYNSLSSLLTLNKTCQRQHWAASVSPIKVYTVQPLQYRLSSVYFTSQACIYLGIASHALLLIQTWTRLHPQHTAIVQPSFAPLPQHSNKDTHSILPLLTFAPSAAAQFYPCLDISPSSLLFCYQLACLLAQLFTTILARPWLPT
jgi:hypothetical protein